MSAGREKRGPGTEETPLLDPQTEKLPYVLERREFLRHAAAGAAALALQLSGASPSGPGVAEGAVSGEQTGNRSHLARRQRQATRYRNQAAKMAARRNKPLLLLANNGEELDYPYVGNFSKGLPHNGLGEVDHAAYEVLLRAVSSGNAADFDAIPLGLGRKLTSPQAGLAFDLQGPDSHCVGLRPAPRIDGAENSSEMTELYWMALCRDVAFADYASDAIVADAADDLSAFSDFRGPAEGSSVTPHTLFRGTSAGNLVGPFLSQFLLRDVPYGSLTISHRQRTILPGLEYLTVFDDWLDAQNGATAGPDAFDPTPRYIRNFRDLAQYVHVDALYEAYLNACLILLGMGAPVDAGLPPVSSPNQNGFAEFGGPHILSLVTEVSTRALKAVWCQKWLVHRRLRPEEFGGRIHNHLTGRATHPIHDEVLSSPVLGRIHSRFGSYLLPQAFPEGCPTHPAYGSGHATVAGACVTILKAFFDESFVLADPVVASADGTGLLPYVGPDLTVGGELNKVAANIATGRNAAGIHWRTDFSEGLLLGEQVALGILEEQKLAHNQPFTYTLTRFDGTTITI